ncbi:MAG: hypothetical protein WA869_20480 [Alloacidobacterium sp.]
MSDQTDKNDPPLGLPARVGISIMLSLVSLFAILWLSLKASGFSSFDYARLKEAVAISVLASALTFFMAWSKNGNKILSVHRRTFAKVAAYVSVLLALDSLVIEPYILRFVWPRFGLVGDFRWQCQLIVAGLLALAVAVAKRTWKWVPFGLITTAFGVMWVLGILYSD